RSVPRRSEPPAATGLLRARHHAAAAGRDLGEEQLVRLSLRNTRASERIRSDDETCVIARILWSAPGEPQCAVASATPGRVPRARGTPRVLGAHKLAQCAQTRRS